MKKALIAMSGGVDSSVAAYLAKEAGYECVGATMKLFAAEGADSKCCSVDDVEDARSVAFSLGMKYYVFNFEREFKSEVIDRFTDAYFKGRTPNPCIDCNRYLKFGKLHQRALELGCDKVVTGHYARVVFNDDTGLYELRRAVDRNKDQTYVLWSMTQAQLEHTLFPLGEMTKAQARELAGSLGFVSAEKKDSQDICFAPDGDYASVIERYTGRKCMPGSYVDESGAVLGTHKGVIHYTVGQHRGLGIALGKPAYVKSIDVENNTVTLSDDAALYSDYLEADDFNVISGSAPPGEIRCTAKVRYRHREQPCTAVFENGGVKVVFDEPVRAITAGQSVVLYDGDCVIGGGIITKTSR